MTFSITAQDLFKLASLAAGEFGANVDEALAILRRVKPEDHSADDNDDVGYADQIGAKPIKPE